ncbi:MAG TPA: hypothetical protein VGC57_10700 [Cellulomonas sp.]
MSPWTGWKKVLVMAAVLGATAGCAGPSQEALWASSDLAYDTTVGTSQQAIDRIPVLFPDVAFERNDFPEDEDFWADCSSSSQGSALHPTAIQWSSLRQVLVDPPRETASIAAALVETYRADGWVVIDDEARDGGQAHELRRGGYGMTVLSVTEPSENLAALVRVMTYSPCLDAPENMGEWQWRPGPTAPPTPAPSSAEG